MSRDQAVKIVDLILEDLRDRAGFCVECDSEADDKAVHSDLVDIVMRIGQRPAPRRGGPSPF